MIEKEFWIINTSKRGISLSDLRMTVPAGKAINLLDKRYHITIEEVKKSVESGALYRKRNEVLVCPKKPEFDKSLVVKMEISDKPFLMKPRSAVKVTIPQYDELIFSDEQYADDVTSEIFKEEK